MLWPSQTQRQPRCFAVRASSLSLRVTTVYDLFDPRARYFGASCERRGLMALSFFHGGQLAKGVQAYEEEGDGSHAQSLRRLYSETALRERYLDNGSRPSLVASRPRTASGHGGLRATSRPRSGRPETSRARFQDVLTVTNEDSQSTGTRPITSESKAEPTKSKSFWGITKPNFLASAIKPKISGPKSWKQKQAARSEASRSRDGTVPAVQTPAVRTERPRTATPQEPPRDAPSRLRESRRVDTPVAAQSAANPSLFLAESLAHVIVGEWLYKDPHKPGILPQSNILLRHVGPPPRGATGVPQRRWFRIDPYERMLSWSSKWDTVETAEHKMSRKGMVLPTSLERPLLTLNQCPSNSCSRCLIDCRWMDAYPLKQLPSISLSSSWHRLKCLNSLRQTNRDTTCGLQHCNS